MVQKAGADDTAAPDPQTPPRDDPRPATLRRAPSLVLLHTGDGKGKSTAAFGVLLRAVAAGWPVAVAQFIKSGAWRTGEEQMAGRLGVDWYTLGDGFTWEAADLDADRERAAAAWDQAAGLIADGDHRLVILDELTYLCTWGWIPTTAVVSAIAQRPEHVNVVITGRDAPAELVELADTATEMREIKHAYRQGIRAARGIDY